VWFSKVRDERTPSFNASIELISYDLMNGEEALRAAVDDVTK